MTFFESHDARFSRFVMGNAPVKKLATGFDWVEGPVWFGDAGCLLFSDIPNNRILRYTPDYGISTYRAPSNYANGHTRDRQGRMFSDDPQYIRRFDMASDRPKGGRFFTASASVVTMEFAATGTETYGLQPLMGCITLRLMGFCWEKSMCPKSSRTCVLVGAPSISFSLPPQQAYTRSP